MTFFGFIDSLPWPPLWSLGGLQTHLETHQKTHLLESTKVRLGWVRDQSVRLGFRQLWFSEEKLPPWNMTGDMDFLIAVVEIQKTDAQLCFQVRYLIENAWDTSSGLVGKFASKEKSPKHPEVPFFKLRLGALIPTSVCRSVGLSVRLSVRLSVLQKLRKKNTKLYKTSHNIKQW